MIVSVKHFCKLLTNRPFKQTLVEFLYQEWQHCDPQIVRDIMTSVIHYRTVELSIP